MDIDVRVVDSADGVPQDALAVRETVFVEEQGVPADIEVDDHEEEATHFVAYDGDEPVGAARLRGLDERTGKVERVAVLAACRDRGVGTALMERLEAVASQRGLETLTMHSQISAEPFYERFGYERVGEEFEEAGIPHVEMHKALDYPS